MALSVDSALIRWIFIGYLIITILDCFIRPGLINTKIQKVGSLPWLVFLLIPLFGVVIGAVAAFLGVGGSVMTVPLMRAVVPV
ncbi:hypothetical protein AB6E88_11035 [Providencia hangzhouensis]